MQPISKRIGSWLSSVRREEGLTATTAIEDRSADTALIAIQGPQGRGHSADAHRRADWLRFPPLAWPCAWWPGSGLRSRAPAIPARMGLSCWSTPAQAVNAWNALRGAGSCTRSAAGRTGRARHPSTGSAAAAVRQRHLGCTTPLEAGLGRWVKLEKQYFRGQDALVARQHEGLTTALTGLAMDDRAVPRAHYPVVDAIGHADRRGDERRLLADPGQGHRPCIPCRSRKRPWALRSGERAWPAAPRHGGEDAVL